MALAQAVTVYFRSQTGYGALSSGHPFIEIASRALIIAAEVEAHDSQVDIKAGSDDSETGRAANPEDEDLIYGIVRMES